jgi:hypothetical protein
MKNCSGCKHSRAEDGKNGRAVLTCGKAPLANGNTKFEDCTAVRSDSAMYDSCGEQAKWFEADDDFSNFTRN